MGNNADTAKAIEANLMAILVAQGFKVEDLSVDPDADTTPLATPLYQGREKQHTHGQKPKYRTLGYVLAIRFSDPSTSNARSRTHDYEDLIEGAVAVDALNVGSLSASKLVSLVEHGDSRAEQGPRIATIDYPLKVTYRET